MAAPVTARRSLHFNQLDDALAECRSLLDSGYGRAGTWSHGQVARPMALTIDASVNGYPRWMSVFAPIRPACRRFLLPGLMQGRAPAGLRTAAIYSPPSGLDDEREVAALEESVRRFREHGGLYHAHPGFGRFDRAGFERFHAAHAAHHLGFLVPRS
jgi:hypothetical protein